MLAAGEDGSVLRVRAVKRLPPSERWSKELIDRIKGTPWAPVDGAREQVPPVEIPREKQGPDVPAGVPVLRVRHQDALDDVQVPEPVLLHRRELRLPN